MIMAGCSDDGLPFNKIAWAVVTAATAGRFSETIKRCFDGMISG